MRMMGTVLVLCSRCKKQTSRRIYFEDCSCYICVDCHNDWIHVSDIWYNYHIDGNHELADKILDLWLSEKL